MTASADAFSWRRHRVLAAALLVACLLTLGFGARLAASALHWSDRRDMPVAHWMTLGFIAHSWDVDRHELASTLGVVAKPGERLSLGEIAERTKRPLAEIEATVARAIAVEHAAGGGHTGMSATVLRLVATHGPLLVFFAALLSSAGVPVPGTLALLAAGSFVAAGEMGFTAVALAGLGGALIGDQIGYGIGARGGQPALDWATRHGMGPAVTRARAVSNRWGDAGNFLCRWLISPIAPAVNLVSGMIGVPWARFTLFCASGEVVWVLLYVGLGAAFSRSILAIARASGDLGLFLVAGGLAILLALRLRAHRSAVA